jgi:DTW domain-containing protein YfiP
MPTIPTQSRFVVIRHVKEAFKTTNTARLAALAMPSLVIHDGGLRHGPPRHRSSPVLRRGA